MGRTPPPFSGRIDDHTAEQAVASLREYVRQLEGRVRHLEETVAFPMGFAMVALTADQSSPITVGSHIAFDEISRFGKSIAMDTDGIITLTQGATYLVVSHLAAYMNEGYFRLQWLHHPTDTAVTGDTGVTATDDIWLADPVALDASGVCSDAFLITPESNIQIKLDITAVSNGTSIQAGSRVWITEVSR